MFIFRIRLYHLLNLSKWIRLECKKNLVFVKFYFLKSVNKWIGKQYDNLIYYWRSVSYTLIKVSQYKDVYFTVLKYTECLIKICSYIYLLECGKSVWIFLL